MKSLARRGSRSRFGMIGTMLVMVTVFSTTSLFVGTANAQLPPLDFLECLGLEGEDFFDCLDDLDDCPFFLPFCGDFPDDFPFCLPFCDFPDECLFIPELCEEDEDLVDIVAPPISHSLHVTLGGSGEGSVVSFPDSVDCGEVCSRSFAAGMKVDLLATPEPGSVFAGWSGDCTGTAGCVVTMSQSREVTALFEALELIDAESSLVLRYVPRTDTLRATLSSTDDRCVPDRTVSFLQVQPGDDSLLAERSTSARGIARVRGMEDLWGSFYATVESTVVETEDTILTCGAAESL